MTTTRLCRTIHPSQPLLRTMLLAGAALLGGGGAIARAQDDAATAGQAPGQPTQAAQTRQSDRAERIEVRGRAGYGTLARTKTTHVDMGPLGTVATLNTPYAVETVPADVIVNEEARNLSDLYQYFPSLQSEARGGVDFGRPQSRGFESDIVSNFRVDGLNALETTTYPTEAIDSFTVLNGLAGALYGPQNPAGIFDYEFKRPVDDLHRAGVEYDSLGLVNEFIDYSGKAGDWLRYRINLDNGSGVDYVPNSYVRRELASLDLDIRASAQDTIRLDGMHYTYDERGTGASFAYSATTVLPEAPDLAKGGYEPSFGGDASETDIGVARLRHQFNDDWSLSIGGLYESGYRQMYGATDTLVNNSGTYKQTITNGGQGNFVVGSNSEYLNGHVLTGPVSNDLVLGTNGYRSGNYTVRTSATALTLGEASIADPVSFAGYVPKTGGGLYENSQIDEQALIVGDTIGWRGWGLDPFFSWGWINERDWNTKGAISSNEDVNGAFSPTISLTYKPASNQTIYFTYANALQPGDIAPEGTANQYQVLAPYRSEEYEIGYKVDIGSTRLTVDAFRMTRPYAYENPSTLLYEDYGLQRNYGAEFFAQGHLTRDLAVLGGVTWLDPQLVDTGNATTNNKLVVGVPKWQGNVLLDYTMPAALGEALHRLAFNASVHVVDQRAADVTNASFVDGYVTLNLGVRYAVHAFKHPVVARVECDNVANARYWISVYPSSQSGTAGATNTAYAGAPRTFRASLEVDF